MIAWLIEFGSPAIYFCDDGDWCSNANHAHKFTTQGEAQRKADEMRMGDSVVPRVVEHMWDD